MSSATHVHASPATPDTRLSPAVATVTAVVGGLLFFLGTSLHPARDGHGVAAAGGTYGVTHSLQALGLMVLVVALASQLAGQWRNGPRPVWWLAAMSGTLAWLGLIVYDGAHNPATAQHAPEQVHTPDDLTVGGALLLVPALVLFPLGHLVLGAALVRQRRRLTGLLLGAGAVTYTVGGLLIFALGPESPAIQVVEVVGAAGYALGFGVLGAGTRGGGRHLRRFASLLKFPSLRKLNSR